MDDAMDADRERSTVPAGDDESIAASAEPRAPSPGDALEPVPSPVESCAVLDVRDVETFLRGHLPGSGHIPLAELKERRPELPPREEPLLIVADNPATAERAAAELQAMEFTRVFWLDAPLDRIADGLASLDPPARLWRPAPFLEEVLPLLPRGPAADLAAGAGREAVFLAMNGFDVEAWDADPEALARAAALAARHGVGVRTVRADLESDEPGLPRDAFDLAVCFRFLHRPLLPRIAEALRPGGVLVYETYRVGQERFGKPRRARFLLETDELRRAFADLEVLRYEEPSPPEGPWTARIVARRPT